LGGSERISEEELRDHLLGEVRRPGGEPTEAEQPFSYPTLLLVLVSEWKELPTLLLVLVSEWEELPTLLLVSEWDEHPIQLLVHALVLV
jgi:hypothetical protein